MVKGRPCLPGCGIPNVWAGGGQPPRRVPRLTPGIFKDR